FAYLKRFQGLEEVLRELARRGNPTAVFVDGADAALRRLECATIRFASRRLDLAAVSRGCDLAMTNGGHGVTAEMLLAGKPLLQLPIAMEQRMTSNTVQRLGAGESTGTTRGPDVVEKPSAVL